MRSSPQQRARYDGPGRPATMPDMGTARSESGVTLAEVATAIALASDLGLGQPVEHVLRSTIIASRLGEMVQVSDADRTATYWTTLFVTVGCTGQSYELAQLFGDDIELRRGTYRASPSDLGQLAYFLGQAGRGRSLVQRTLLRADLLRTRMRPVRGVACCARPGERAACWSGRAR